MDEAVAGALLRRAWSEAYGLFQTASEVRALSATELERFSTVCYLLGRDQEGQALGRRAEEAYMANGDVPSAARCSFWLGMASLDRGDFSEASGWLGRARRLVEEAGIDCPEQGLVLIPEALQLLDEGEHRAARSLFDRVRQIATAFNDPDLLALTCLGIGVTLIRIGTTKEGSQWLDEGMVAALHTDVSPLVAGIVYCGAIEACEETLDWRRTREWTDTLTRWCEAQPDLVPFQGRCQVYRAQVFRVHGDWVNALDAARAAARRLGGPPALPGLGEAFYQLGELHRLRGAFGDADEAYRKAEDRGRNPQPGRAFLRLEQGRAEAAATAIRHAIDEARSTASLCQLLFAAVDILIRCGHDGEARAAMERLAELQRDLGSETMRTAWEAAMGMVLLAEKNPADAMTHLRTALAGWQSLDAPYETARAREQLGAAARALGDAETADVQWGLARQTYLDLGAAADVRRMAVAQGGRRDSLDGLTRREHEVLRLLATGMTNRAIATTLSISEKTVANHVGNILGTLGLSSRAAATAYAYEHHLV